jgi:hypothetical protein
MTEMSKENWGAGGPYELYVGRWSRSVAAESLDWICVPARADLSGQSNSKRSQSEVSDIELFHRSLSFIPNSPIYYLTTP